MPNHEVDKEDYAPPMGTEERFLYETVALGEEASRFMKSKLATYICEAAEIKAKNAIEKLKTVNPRDWETIMVLQSDVAKFDHFVNSLADMVAAGDSAYQLYLNMTSNE